MNITPLCNGTVQNPLAILTTTKITRPRFLGSALIWLPLIPNGFIDPEQALAASLASCHMLTFLAVCAKKRLTVAHYEDACVAEVKQNADGKFYVNNIQLNPKVTFAQASAPISIEQLKHIHHKAHQHCFISNSLTSRVDINIQQD